ncbi:MAG: CooT family nickel-binding protein [Thermodesulfobacteriota bacterium]|nr:CooT family nickel-binding protein [Thermodesulfobacteriota bacterium]
MCESSVYIKKNNTQELVMENVAAITPVKENSFLLKGLLGDSKEITGRIVDINLMSHKILFETME